MLKVKRLCFTQIMQTVNMSFPHLEKKRWQSVVPVRCVNGSLCTPSHSSLCSHLALGSHVSERSLEAAQADSFSAQDLNWVIAHLPPDLHFSHAAIPVRQTSASSPDFHS